MKSDNSKIKVNNILFDKNVYKILKLLHRKSNNINVDAYIEETLNPNGLKKYKKENEFKFLMKCLKKQEPMQLNLLKKQLKKNGVKFEISSKEDDMKTDKQKNSD